MQTIDKEIYSLIIVCLATELLKLHNQNNLSWSRVSKNGRPLPCGQKDLETVFTLLKTKRFHGSATLRIMRDGTGSVEWSL